MKKPLEELLIVIKGAGEMSSGVASRLFCANLRRIVMLETAAPLAIRRLVSFSEAIHKHSATVEGIQAVRVCEKQQILDAWKTGRIPVRVDPKWETVSEFKPEVVIDAILAKRNLGTSTGEAPLVIALGPGFSAPKDCHVIVETHPGHDFGRLIYKGRARKDTGIPAALGGFTSRRILRSPSLGLFVSEKSIGEPVQKGQTIGWVGNEPIVALIDGVLRGLISPGFSVKPGMKIAEIDPRGNPEYCHTISGSARALGGAVLEAILAHGLCLQSGENCGAVECNPINQPFVTSRGNTSRTYRC